MRNQRLLRNPSREEEISDYMLDIGRAFQDKMAILSRMGDIKIKYHWFVYEKLAELEPGVKMHYMSHSTQSVGERVALSIIAENTLFCGDHAHSFFVLCNPKTGQPSVVTDVYGFVQEAHLMDVISTYIGDYREKEATLRGRAVKTGIKLGTGYAGERLGDHLVARAGRLQRIVDHCSSGHDRFTRVTRSISGKEAQNAAFKSLFNKSKEYAKYSARHKTAGSALRKIAGRMKKGSIKPITPIDVLKPESMRKGTYTDIETARMRSFIPQVLAKYCEHQNNYHYIINQQYFEQR